MAKSVFEDILISGRLHLRAIELHDLDWLYKWENNTELWNLGNTFAPFSRFVLEQYLLTAQNDIFTNKQLRLMIDLNNPDNEVQTIGSIDLFDFDPFHRRAGIGILIITPERNKGYAYEALDLMKNYAFSLLELHQLYCNISSENQSSIELFMKHDFVECGRKKDWIWGNGSWHDELIFQCIRPSDSGIKH
ncbi:MAG: GNAT family N-acetyltransferase [Bacteroidales bacterium]